MGIRPGTGAHGKPSKGLLMARDVTTVQTATSPQEARTCRRPDVPLVTEARERGNVTSGLLETPRICGVSRAEVRPIRRIAVAVQEADGGGFLFSAVDGDDAALRWSGTLRSATADVALLEVFVQIRREIDLPDRIRFLVRVPRGSLLWAHQEELRSALPNCTIQGPGPRDGDLMTAAEAGLPAETPPPVDQLLLPALTVAADGSVRGRFGGYGWLASDGRYGLQGRIDSRTFIGCRASMVAELRAIDDAVRKVPGRRLNIFCDNSYAVSMARKWMDGQQILPEGYRTERAAGKTAGLLIAQRRLHLNRARIDIRWTRSHQGEPLNEGADALARLASRYIRGDSGLSPTEYRRRARGLAEAFAAEFCASHEPIQPPASPTGNIARIPSRITAWAATSDSL